MSPWLYFFNMVGYYERFTANIGNGEVKKKKKAKNTKWRLTTSLSIAQVGENNKQIN